MSGQLSLRIWGKIWFGDTHLRFLRIGMDEVPKRRGKVKSNPTEWGEEKARVEEPTQGSLGVGRKTKGMRLQKQVMCTFQEGKSEYA